jgi:HEAT repeat protein
LGAVQALNALADLQASELLPEIQALPQNHPSPIASAVEATRLHLNDATLIPELQRRAQDRRQSDIDRIVAWEAVGGQGDRSLAIESLRGFFRHFHSPQTQRRAALALARLGAGAAVLSLEHHLEHSPPAGRADFCEAFFNQRSYDQALPLWESLTRSQSNEARRSALSLSAAHPRAEMIPGLQSLLSDPYPEIRIEAGRRLVELASNQGDVAILETLLERAEPSSLRASESLQVRAAEAILARGDHAAAREILRSYLESSFGEIRLQAAEALLDRGDSSAAVQALRSLSQGQDVSLRHRAASRLLGYRGIENTSLNGRLGTSIGLLGLGALAWLLDPSIAEASVGAASSQGSWGLPALLIGAVAVAAMRGGRGSEPPSPGATPPAETLGWFESAYDAAETYSVPAVGETGIVIGRSTLRAPNVFGADLRHISRQHMDLRVQQDQIEVRLHDGARGLRINGQNLLPFQWHPLRDQDLVEFVGPGNAEARVLRPTEEGNLVPTILRFGQRPVEARDVPAIFRFRLTPPANPPPPPIPPRPRHNLVERIGNFFGGSRPTPESESAASRLTPPGIAAIRTNLHAEIAQLSQTLSTPMALLEATLRSPNFQSAASRNDTLTALIRIHRQICGRAETMIWAEISEERRAEGATGWIRVPDWDGILSQRLEHFGRSLQQIEQERGIDSETQGTRLELGRIRDQLNRLFEMVRLFRRHFHEPEELVRLDAIEQAYRGLRPEVVPSGQRVRSMTRGLDATVRPADRQAWIQEFESWERPSRSMVNLRILMGEIRAVRGRRVAGSFYSALSSGTIYEGRRNVHFFFDTSSGQILGFDDGSPISEGAIQRFRQDRLNVEEGILSVDPSGSGRITEVTLLGPARDTVAEALHGLRELRVLPPQVVHGWNGHAGDPDLQGYRLHLVPEFESPREEWYRIAGLIPQFEPGQSLLTIEPLSPSPERQGIQVLVPELDILGVSVDDVLTVSPVSP